jgi:hypothetical protein
LIEGLKVRVIELPRSIVGFSLGCISFARYNSGNMDGNVSEVTRMSPYYLGRLSRVSVMATLLCFSVYPCSILYAQSTTSGDEAQGVSMDEFALARILGTTHASYDICRISTTSWGLADLDVMMKSRYVIEARYRQLGRGVDAALRDEQVGYDSYMKFHKLNSSAPDCKIFQRQIYALTWNTVLVSKLYIQTNEASPVKP